MQVARPDEMTPHALCPAHPYLEKSISDLSTRHDSAIRELSKRQEKILEICEASQEKIGALSLSLGQHRAFHEGKESAESSGVNWRDKGADVLKWFVISVITLIVVLILNHAANLVGVFGGK
jgi:hypothetical protein